MSDVPQHSPLQDRRAGVLLHPTSLPGPWPNGDLGPEAYRFVDFLVEAGQRVWQILPIGPTHSDGSPYQSLSVHAGNPDLISIDLLLQWGWLDRDDVSGYGHGAKTAAVRQAHRNFPQRADDGAREERALFDAEQAWWLEDYALFRVLKLEHDEAGWADWPAPLRDREPGALEAARERHSEMVDLIRFEQFVFYRQWHMLKAHANGNGIGIFGDMPIFVAHDSADVWARRECFLLGDDGRPTVVAGVPPDYFSETGQRWGNPHYDWSYMEGDGFSWWQQRMRSQLELFDLVRVDHFRGFEAYWEVPAHEETAINGHWVQAPGDALFARLRELFDPLPVVAEDLGTITPEVLALRDKYALPGMKVLHFAFEGGPDNPYLPHNHESNSVVYTGTHDNDTTLGWFDKLADGTAVHVMDYLGNPAESMPWPLVRACYASVANLAVVPLQDVLALGSEHRMNIPGTNEGNWNWRFSWDRVPNGLTGKLRHLCGIYGRLG